MKKAAPQLKKKVSKGEHRHIHIHLPKNLSNWLIIGLFLITTIIFFRSEIFGSSYFWEDFTEYVYPTQTFAARESASGVMPFWNPYTFTGMPFLADLQAGFFYPFNRIMSFFVRSDGTLPVLVLELLIMLHFFIAQLAMYRLLRHWKASAWASVIGALSYSFSLLMVCHVIHPMIIEHLAWFPLVVSFFHKGLELRSFRQVIGAGLLLGMSMLSGHPQMTLYEALFLIFMALWWFVAGLMKKELTGKKLVKFIICAILPLVIAAGIFSVQYLPSKELAELSQRAESSYQKSSEGSLEFKQIYTALMPKLFGFVDGAGDKSIPYHLTITKPDGAEVQAPYYNYWETSFYFGIAAIILGLFGAAIKIKDRTAAFLAAAGIFGFLFALGSNGFIFPLFYNLPLFGTFRNPTRMMFYFVFALSALSAFGFDALWAQLKNKKTFIRLIAVSSIIAFFGILISTGALSSIFSAPEQVKPAVQSAGTLGLFMIIAIAIIMILMNKGLLKTEFGGVIIIIITIIDLNIAGASFNEGTQNPEDVYKLDTKTLETFKPNPPRNIFRINSRMYNPSYMALQRNQGLVSGIMTIEGYNPLILQRVMPPLRSRDEVNEMYNVKYQIDMDPSAGKPGFTERTSYFQRAWLVHKAVVANPDSVKNLMLNSNFNFKEIAVLEEKPGLNLPKEPAAGVTSDRVECLEYKSNAFKYRVQTQSAGLLCFSEIWYPAWAAYIDGKPVKVHRANYCFRAVEVPQGNHEIVMKYESSSFYTGLFITIFTLLASISGIIMTYTLHKRK
ncbi:MAG: hypothetical protein QG635_1264 [Bacteroidota bacterium]|nr:hypothetical protein [Bacteroidota bacterium]